MGRLTEQTPNGRLKIYVLKADGTVVAGASGASKEAWLPLGRCDRAGQLPKPPKSATSRVNGIPCPSSIPPGR